MPRLVFSQSIGGTQLPNQPYKIKTMKYTEHRTHTGETIKGNRVTDAVKAVCDEWRELALAVRAEDSYASHVSEEEKDEYLKRSIILANDLEAGKINPTFTDWQRINIELTGECVAFLA